MSRLLLIATIAASLWGCAAPRAPANGDSYESEKTALEQATAEGTSGALDRFLRAFPNSSWTEIAIYRRDRAALEEARQIGTREAFEEFLKRYPNSAWADQARYYLEFGDRLKR